MRFLPLNQVGMTPRIYTGEYWRISANAGKIAHNAGEYWPILVYGFTTKLPFYRFLALDKENALVFFMLFAVWG